MSVYKTLKNIDIDVNESWNGNRRMTISRQAARGLQVRHDYSVGDKSAMDMAHGNMLAAGAGIVGGLAIIASAPILGTLAVIGGAAALGKVKNDWDNGKCSNQKYCW